MTATLPVAFLLGLASTLHCWGMCGGILAAFTLGIPGPGVVNPGQRGLLITGFNLGRVTSYVLGGTLAGAIGNAVVLLPLRAPLFMALQVMAGIILIITALRLGGWLRSGAWIESAGARLWRNLQPWCRALLPVDRLGRALALGVLWGWIPCGLVYSALAWSAASADPLVGAATMLAFGAGTLPGMLAAGLAGSQISTRLANPALRQGLAAVLILAGVLGPVLSLYFAAVPHHATHMH
jgi:hypothetical protein